MQIKLRWRFPTSHEIAMILRCQVAFRKKNGGLARHMAKQAKLYKEEEEKIMHAAALRVQGAWRRKQGTYASFILQRARNSKVMDEQEREEAAVRLQCAWRKKKGTFAQHMLKAARRDVKKDKEIERLRLIQLQELKEISAAIQIQHWWNNRHFHVMTNLVAAAIEQKRIEDLITNVQSHVRGMVARTWMRKRHEIATTTAAAFRGYVGRMGIRLKKKLKRQRAAKTIACFVHECLSIKEAEFMKKDDSALIVQKMIRGVLVRWRSHSMFKTAVRLWGLEVLHDQLGRPVGKDTARALKDGQLLANAIWCRYPTPNKGAMFAAARGFMVNAAAATAATAASPVPATPEKMMAARRMAWSERPFMKTFTKTGANPFEDSNQRATPQSIGRRLKEIDLSQTLQPTYMHSNAFTLSRAIRANTAVSNEIVRWRAPRHRPPTKPPPPHDLLAWGPEAAKSLKLDVNSLVASRQKEWVTRHVQNKWQQKEKARRKAAKKKLQRLMEDVVE